MENLKNCPFCGSSSIDLTEAYGRKNASVFAECLDCGATGIPFAIGHDAEAVNAWNTRVERTCKMIPFVEEDDSIFIVNCNECGDAIFARGGEHGCNYCPNCGAKVKR